VKVAPKVAPLSALGPPSVPPPPVLPPGPAGGDTTESQVVFPDEVEPGYLDPAAVVAAVLVLAVAVVVAACWMLVARLISPGAWVAVRRS
jgi:hypothetical protein